VICNNCGVSIADPAELSLDQTHIEINDEQWKQAFSPIKNHLDNNAAWDGAMYETYGEEYDFVKSFVTHKPNHVWTLMDDDDGNPMIGSGWHFVNRLGYFITMNPFRCDVSVIYNDDYS
jgi:hypothetical protein